MEIPIRINIMGTMGVGKSTIVEAIKNKWDIPTITEKFEDNPYWGDAYAGKNPEFLKMQISFMNQYIENFIMLSDHQALSIVMDNQFLSGYAFVMAQYAEGMINAKDMRTYVTRHHLLCCVFLPVLKSIRHFILVDSERSILKKILNRDREQEDSISLSYLKNLNYHFRALSDRMAAGHNLTVPLINVGGLKEGTIPVEIMACLSEASKIHPSLTCGSRGLRL